MFDIPELLDITLSLLSTQDLAHCLLVNKEWHNAAIPHLWHTISRLTYSQKGAFQRTVLEDFLRVQQRQGHQLKLSLADRCRLIRRLDNPQNIFIHLKRFKSVYNGHELLSHLLKSCENVTALSLDDVYDRDEEFCQAYNIVAEKIAPNLRELSLQWSRDDQYFGRDSHWAFYILSRCSSHLRKLKLYNEERGIYPVGAYRKDLDFKDMKLVGLRELVLDHCWSSDELPLLDSLWRSFGNVERLELKAWYGHLTQDLADRIRTFVPKVNSIVFQGESTIKAIAPLLSACPGGWKEIRTDLSLGRFSCEAITEHCTTLEKLQVTNILEFSSKTLHRILSSSPQLTSLITIDDKWHHRRRIPYLEAEDFVDVHTESDTLKPWACEGCLVVLKIKIIGIPRPDVTELLDGRKRCDIFNGRGRKIIQKRIYERLARFTKVEELCLGHDTKANRHSSPDSRDGEDYQYDCLEMTLESGLDGLKSLSELQVLDVQRMEQRIGVKEVQWMTLHWPRLREIRGLNDAGCNFEAAQWLWKHSLVVRVEVSSRGDHYSKLVRAQERCRRLVDNSRKPFSRSTNAAKQ